MFAASVAIRFPPSRTSRSIFHSVSHRVVFRRNFRGDISRGNLIRRVSGMRFPICAAPTYAAALL